MKNRTRIPDDTVAEVEFAHDRTCCVCREPGKNFQIHHIDENPTNHAHENLAVLCLDDHVATQVRGGFVRTLKPATVERYRREWLKSVEERRRRANEIAAMRMAPRPQDEAPPIGDARMVSADPALVEYVSALPAIYRAGSEKAQLLLASSTGEMAQGLGELIALCESIFLVLAKSFPDLHFSELKPETYFSMFIQNRFAWHRALANPTADEFPGSIVGIHAAAGVLADARRAIEEVVHALLEGTEGFRFDRWRAEWDDAGSPAGS